MRPTEPGHLFKCFSDATFTHTHLRTHACTHTYTYVHKLTDCCSEEDAVKTDCCLKEELFSSEHGVRRLTGSRQSLHTLIIMQLASPLPLSLFHSLCLSLSLSVSLVTISTTSSPLRAYSSRHELYSPSQFRLASLRKVLSTPQVLDACTLV